MRFAWDYLNLYGTGREVCILTPKPRAEGSSPSAPAKENTDFSVLFSFIYGYLRRFYLLFSYR